MREKHVLELLTVNAHCPVLGLFSLWSIYQTGYQDPVPPSSETHPISLPSPPFRSSFCRLPSDARALQEITLYDFDLAQGSVTLAIQQTSTATIHNGPLGFLHLCTTVMLLVACSKPACLSDIRRCVSERRMASICGVNGDTEVFF